MTPSEISNKVDFQTLSAGSVVEVETLGRHYRIECLGLDLIRISGHPDFCPSPASALLQGSLDDQGTVAVGAIEPGMRLAYFVDGLGPVTTSRVVSVEVKS
jgi:hypothetical protein